MVLRRENPARRETVAAIEKWCTISFMGRYRKSEEAAIPQETAIQLMSAGSLVQKGNRKTQMELSKALICHLIFWGISDKLNNGMP